MFITIMKKRDYLIIISITTLLLLAILLTKKASVQGRYVKINSGSKVMLYPIDIDRTIELDGNTVVINGGHVYVSEATCPDKLCMSMGEINSTDEQIVCLPHKLVVEVTDELVPTSVNGFYFDTYVELTMFDSEDTDILNGAMDICAGYELICSSTDINSELYKLNHRLLPETNKNGIICYQISDELYDMISTGLELSKQSSGKFNIALGAVTSLWDFTGGDSSLPEKKDITEALLHTDINDISLYGDNMISIADDRLMIDLGGMAKGYIADVIKDYLKERNVNSAIISLGHNINLIGDKLGEDFTVGIKKPFTNNEIITTIKTKDKSVVTSGIYERYFESDGRLYHHILSPTTGYPVDNDLSSITIISDSSLMGDYLSTYLFILGSEDAGKYNAENDDIDIIRINKEIRLLD